MSHLQDLQLQRMVAQRAVDNFEVDTDDATVIEMYESMLADCYGETVCIAGCEYDTARALKEIDPTAYRCGMNDWVDGLDKQDFPEYVELQEALGKAKEAYAIALEKEQES